MSKRVWPPASATYKISGWLGSGTFGAVFKARRRSTHDNPSQSSSVAVKVIPRYSFASSRELEVMQILREKPHVAVMQLIECFSVASTEASAARILTCLVLPLYDSCLRTYLDAPEHAAKHSDAVTRILRLQHIGGQLSSALAHLHALRIIHRDLKPENVMVQYADAPQGLAYRDGNGLACVLADFGSAKVLDSLTLDAAAAEHESTATATTAAPSIPYVCTRPYRAPELFYGAECYRGEPDVWSLGCLLCDVLLCGEQLFDAERVDGHQVLRKEEKDAKSAAQLHLLHSCLGTPTEQDIVDMNPALRTDARLLRLLSPEAMLPAQPRADWRVRLAETISECGEARGAECGGVELVDAVLRLFRPIFVYSPQARPTAAYLERLSFWAARLY